MLIHEKLWQTVTEFMQCPSIREVSMEAFEVFFGHPSPDKEDLDETTLARFYEWFVWDCYLSDRRRVFSLFLEYARPRVTAQEYRILQRWKSCAIQVCQVKSLYDGKVELTDMLTGEDFFVETRLRLILGDFYIGRWLPLGKRLIPTNFVYRVAEEHYMFLHKKMEGIYYGGFSGSLKSFLRRYGFELETWSEELKERYGSRLLFFEVQNYRKLVVAMSRLRDLRKQEGKVTSIFGPLQYVYSYQGEEAQVILDTGELLVSSSSEKVIDRLRSIFSYGLADAVSYLYELPEAMDFREQLLDMVISVPWRRPQEKKVAFALLQNTFHEGSHFEQSLSVWFDFCGKSRPVCRKPQGWAAAIEYAVREINSTPAKKGDLEQRYGVSTMNILQKYGRIKECLGLTKGDERYRMGDIEEL